MTGKPFSCDLCHSPYVCNPLLSKGGSRFHRSRHMPSPRQKISPITGKTLTLCNACGKFFQEYCHDKALVEWNYEQKWMTKFACFFLLTRGSCLLNANRQNYLLSHHENLRVNNHNDLFKILSIRMEKKLSMPGMFYNSVRFCQSVYYCGSLIFQSL